MTENIENKVGNFYNGIRKGIYSLVLAGLGFTAGCSYYPNSERNLESENLKPLKIYLENNKKVPKNSLQKKVEKYSDIFVYVKDENLEDYELRMKTHRLSEKERLDFISVKGTYYNREKGYIFFNSEFEDKEFYNSMKNIAVLSQVCDDGIVSDREKRFVKENAPDVYDYLFSSEDEAKEEKMKKDYKPEDHPYIEGLVKFSVDFWLRAQVANEERKIREAFLGDGEIITTKDGKMYGIKKGEKINKKILDEATEPPKPLDLK